jgi:hypothetical protein
MGERRALVVGSQCAALPSLSFLPGAAHDLAVKLLDPSRGACVAALPTGAMFVDPTGRQLDALLVEAFERAATDEATLVIALIGHGTFVRDDFYFMAWDSHEPEDMYNAYPFGQRVEQLLGRHSTLDGLVVLLDTCHAGVAADQAGENWVRIVGQAGRRFELLTASDHRTAADGCFSRSLTRMLDSGVPALGERLHPWQLRNELATACATQTPVYLAFDGRAFAAEGDEGLWLSWNPARAKSLSPLAGTVAASQAERLTTWYQPTPQLLQVIGASRNERCVAVLGAPGAGKSTLLAALSRPELAGGSIPPGFLACLVFAAPFDTVGGVARAVGAQLARSVHGFGDAASRIPEFVAAGEDVFDVEVIRPLRDARVPAETPARIALDGFDQWSGDVAASVTAALERLLTDPELPGVHVILSSRTSAGLPSAAVPLRLTAATDDELAGYLRRRRIDPRHAEDIVSGAGGSWLVARLVADVSDGLGERAELPTTLEGAYDCRLDQLRVDAPEAWRAMLAPLLAILAAAGAGPVLPIALLREASRELGGPAGLSGIRDGLAQLGTLIVRGRPGDPDEHVGLFHPTFTGYLAGRPDLAGLVQASHEALVSAIERLTGAGLEPNDSVVRYASTAEPEHLWALERFTDAVERLYSWRPASLRERQDQWTQWYARAQRALGEGHPASLRLRRYLARLSSRHGNKLDALHEMEAVLSRQNTELGPRHQDTLRTRFEMARLTAEAGDRRQALNQLRVLLTEQEDCLGASSMDAFRTRSEIAMTTGRLGDRLGAVRQYRRLLADQLPVLTERHPTVLFTRAQIAYWIGTGGNPDLAVDLLTQVRDDQREILGPDSTEVAYTTSTLARLRGKKKRPGARPGTLPFAPIPVTPATDRLVEYPPEVCGDYLEAVSRWQEADPDAAISLLRRAIDLCATRCGSIDYRTVMFRDTLARWRYAIGDVAEAVHLQEALRDDLIRVRGADDPAAMTAAQRHNRWSAQRAEPLAASRPPVRRPSGPSPLQRLEELVESGTIRHFPEPAAALCRQAADEWRDDRHGAAIATAREALALTYRERGGKGGLAARLAAALALWLDDEGERDAAVTVLRQALREMVPRRQRKGTGKGLPSMLSALLERWRGSTGSAGPGPVSLPSNEKARRPAAYPTVLRLEEITGSDSIRRYPDHIAELCRQAVTEWQADRRDSALTTAREALARTRLACGVRNRLTLDLSAAVALWLHESNRTRDAVALLDKARRELAVGRRTAGVGKALGALAEDWQESVLQAAQETWPDGVAVDLRRLDDASGEGVPDDLSGEDAAACAAALAARAAGDSSAVDQLRDVADLFGRRYGAIDPRTQRLRRTVAHWLRQYGNRDAAISALASLRDDLTGIGERAGPYVAALSTMLRLWLTESPDVRGPRGRTSDPGTWHILPLDAFPPMVAEELSAARAAKLENRIDDALRSLQSSIDRASAECGTADWRTLSLRCEMGEWLRQTGNPAAARAEFEEIGGLLGSRTGGLSAHIAGRLAENIPATATTDQPFPAPPASTPGLKTLRTLDSGTAHARLRKYPAAVADGCLKALDHYTHYDLYHAMPVLAEMVTLAGELCGPLDKPTLELRYTMADWHRQSGDETGAISLLQQLCDDLSAEHDKANTPALHKLNATVKKWRDEYRRKQEYQRAVASAPAPPTDPPEARPSGIDSLLTGFDRAVTAKQNGELDTAIAQLRMVIDEATATFPDDDDRVVELQGTLADWMWERGDHVEAITLVAELYRSVAATRGKTSQLAQGLQRRLDHWITRSASR